MSVDKGVNLVIDVIVFILFYSYNLNSSHRAGIHIRSQLWKLQKIKLQQRRTLAQQHLN